MLLLLLDFLLFWSYLTFSSIFVQGVPLRIEIGPRDVSNGTVVLSRRDVPGKQGKTFGVSTEPSILESQVREHLDDIQTALLQKATLFRDRYTFCNCKTLDDVDYVSTIQSTKISPTLYT